MERLPFLLIVIGVFFLVVNVQLLWQLLRFRQLRRSALLTWPGRTPPFYRLFLLAGAMLAVVIVCKLAVLHRPPTDVFGESMMLVYYSYAQPLSLKIGRGFYQDGIWAEGGFVPYSKIGGLTWREGEQVTLVMMFRWRNFAKSLVVPQPYYGAARRLLRDKIATHDIHFTGKTLDLGVHDERDDVYVVMHVDSNSQAADRSTCDTALRRCPARRRAPARCSRPAAGCGWRGRRRPCRWPASW